MRKFLKVAIPLAIYLVYAYLFSWQIYDLNLTSIYEDLKGGDPILYKQTAAIIIVLYGLLLYLNVIHNQRKLVVLNSFFVASLLFMHPGIFPTITSLLLMLFGLTVVFFEIRQMNRPGQV